MNAACSIHAIVQKCTEIYRNILKEFLYLRDTLEGRSVCGQEGNIKRWFEDTG